MVGRFVDEIGMIRIVSAQVVILIKKEFFSLFHLNQSFTTPSQVIYLPPHLDLSTHQFSLDMPQLISSWLCINMDAISFLDVLFIVIAAILSLSPFPQHAREDMQLRISHLCPKPSISYLCLTMATSISFLFFLFCLLFLQTLRWPSL